MKKVLQPRALIWPGRNSMASGLAMMSLNGTVKGKGDKVKRKGY